MNDEAAIPTDDRQTGLAFVACIEAGELEPQALLLFESIRRNCGRYKASAIHAFSPRRGMAPSRFAKRRKHKLGVQYHDDLLNSTCVEYGSANRVAAAAYVERHYAYDTIVVLDSDTLFLAEPEAFALGHATDFRARPVDVKGMCSSGAEDPRDAYWQALAGLHRFDLRDLPLDYTFVDRQRVRVSYNGGLVVSRSGAGILRAWSDLFFASVEQGMRPHPGLHGFQAGAGMVDTSAASWWGSNQAALALAAWSQTRRISPLDARYNYPLHLHGRLADEGRALPLDDLIHVHYHWLLSPAHRQSCPLFDAVLGLTGERRDWLLEAVERH